MNRRTFLTSATGFAASSLTAPAWLGRFPAQRTVLRSGPHRQPTLVLRGGRVYDGTGASPAVADVAVEGDRILGVGPALDPAGAEVLDCDGLAVAPGFIDIHAHTDLSLFINPNAESKVRQGVTLEVAGQDGNSIGPWSDEQARQTRDRYREEHDVDLDFHDLEGFFARLSRTPGSVNLASMIGAGTVRGYVIGHDDRRATQPELAHMVALVQAALDAGACGLSTGLEYIPGAFADLDELVALSQPLRGTGLPYTSHMRNEDDLLLAAVEEALNVGRLAGVPVQISHLKAQGQRNWWKAEPSLRLLEHARADGIDVAYDRYPYVAYSTGLSSLFPVWARDGGTDAFLARLADPNEQPRIEQAVREKILALGSWDAVQITSTGSDSLAWTHGKRLGTLAQERGQEPYALLEALIVQDRSRTAMVGFGMGEENTAQYLKHPLGIICSDGGARATYGPLSSGTPHPRTYGSFPRVLGHYCREQNLMPLETAVYKMTAFPAERLRFTDRGRIAPGLFADLVVFDPATVADNATFENPHQYPTGIPHVIVNGTFVIKDGEHTGAHPGRIVKPTPLSSQQ